MHVLITGSQLAGMLGRKLTERLVRERTLGGRDITSFSLIDVVAPEKPAGFGGHVTTRAADLSAEGEAARAVESRPDLVVHLAAVVSGEAEADFEKGYRVNLDGTRALFEAVRQEGLEASSYKRAPCLHVFGRGVRRTPFPEAIGDEFFLTPLTSYGTQKAMVELLLADYTRRGFIDGVGIRLPTICIRPGKPNKAASAFFSNILREPLAGQEAVLPVSEDVRHWVRAGPRAAVGFLIHAATIDLALLGWRRNLNMPGLSRDRSETRSRRCATSRGKKWCA